MSRQRDVRDSSGEDVASRTAGEDPERGAGPVESRRHGDIVPGVARELPDHETMGERLDAAISRRGKDATSEVPVGTHDSLRGRVTENREIRAAIAVEVSGSDELRFDRGRVGDGRAERATSEPEADGHRRCMRANVCHVGKAVTREVRQDEVGGAGGPRDGAPRVHARGACAEVHIE